MREASWKFTYLVRLLKSLMGVVTRCGPRDTVTVLSHLDECVLFRGCFSISSCEAKISTLCLPICWRCGDPVLLLQLCARDWCWSSHAGPAICCLHLLSMAVVMLFFTHISAISSHLISPWLPRDWTFYFGSTSYTKGSVNHLWVGGGAGKVLPLVCICCLELLKPCWLEPT